MFDSQFYISNYGCFLSKETEPLEHFCSAGWMVGFSPSENFDINYYLRKYEDVNRAKVNPLVHWIRYGRGEGRFTKEIVASADSSKAPSPSLIFISHEASQTGAPAVLLSLMRWIKENTSINFSIIVGARGPWNDRFEMLAPTFYIEHYQDSAQDARLRAFCGNHVQTVYVNTIASAFYAEKLKFLHAEFITHVHEMENVFQLFQPHVRLLKTFCSKYISVSPGCTKAIEKHFDLSQIELFQIPPFIEKSRLEADCLWEPLEGSAIFGCGAVETRKGFDIFCEVAKILKTSRCQAFNMYWIGSDTDKDLAALNVIADYGVADVVHFLGPKANPRDYFQRGQLFLLTSREDPFPLVCLEAAEAGMPVICFDENAGGMHQFVEDDAGLVVSYLDGQAMAQAVTKFLDNETSRREAGRRAKQKVQERYYVDSVAPRILKVLPDQSKLNSSTALANYKALIKASKAVSFDIFDTLITRRVSDPKIVFDIIEHQHTQSEPAALSFFEQRMAAAGNALSSQNRPVDDIPIDTIYQHMVFHTDADLEKRTEIKLCVAHPIGRILYDYAMSLGKTIYITSDMYLDVDTIRTILIDHGYDRWSGFFLSSEQGRKKDTGRLFGLVTEHAKLEGILPNEILHIGDNWDGDIKHSRQAGLTAVRFSPLQEQDHKLIQISDLDKLSQIGRVWESFSTQATHLWREASPELANDFFVRLGFEMTGPLASMMAIHTRSIAEQHRASRIIFMARDGRIIYKAFRELYHEDITSSVVQVEYLHLSRATVVSATLNHPLTSNDIYCLCEGLHLGSQPLNYFISKAGLSIEHAVVQQSITTYFGSEDYIPNWGDLNKLARLFTDLSPQIFEANQSSRDALLHYLRDRNLISADPTAVIVVDVGWLLNVQSRLESFIKRHGGANRLVGSYVGSRQRVNKQISHFPLMFKQGDPAEWSSFFEQHVTLFELLFSSPEAPASGLELDEQKNAKVRFKALELPITDEYKVAQKLHLGAERYIKEFALARLSFFPEQVSRDYFFQLFSALVNSNSHLVKAMLGTFQVKLGAHHEFLAIESLVSNRFPYEYKLKVSDEYFAPVFFGLGSKEIPEVVIVTSAGLDNGSTRYRAINLGESLSNQRLSAVLIHSATDLGTAERLICGSHTVVFQRCFEDQGQIRYYIEFARTLGRRCFADIDDLVFPEHIGSIGSVKGGEWDAHEAMFVAKSYEKLIVKMDRCVCSTIALKLYIEDKYGISSFVICNKISRSFVRGPQRASKVPLRLIYASGSLSHKQDFLLIEDVLFQFLVEHPHVHLSTLGAAQVSERILALPNVTSHPMLPYPAMVEYISQHHLMLVPLEDDAFNRAKSIVKFIESGAVGVPVLASMVGEFAQCISDAKDGLLARDKSDWTRLLDWANTNPDSLENIGQRAFDLVCSRYTTALIEDIASFRISNPRS